MRINERGIGALLAVSAALALSLASGRLPAQVATPTELPGSEAHVYAVRGDAEMRLFVVKPKGWSAADRRTGFVYFFGGGWTRGTAEKSVGWARMAANLGMVGVAPDYRTNERFGTTPLECVADARASVRWVQEHAGELGIDPERIVVGGNSAGGHLALWTAIEKAPPGSDAAESPKSKPAALVLSSAPSDTAPLKGYTARRFGEHAEALSPVHNLDAKMPPILMFHGDADRTVPYEQSVELNRKLLETGNRCKFVTVPGGSHGFREDLPEWKDKTKEHMVKFLEGEKLLPAVAQTP